MNLIYRCARFDLRLAELSDAAAVADFYSRNRSYLQPFHPTFEESQFEVAAWQSKIRRFLEEAQLGQTLRLFLVNSDRGVIGVLSFVEIRGNPQFECRVGYALDEKEQGHGSMTAALQAGIAYVFGNLKMHRVVAAYMPRNERSGKLLRKVGFRVEGYARDYIMLNGRWEDHLLTSLTNEDWKA